MTVHPVLIDGHWRPASASSMFQAVNPVTREPLPDQYPVSGWADCDAALQAAARAAAHLRTLPSETPATFLERFAQRIEQRGEQLVDAAHAETGYPKTPRLAAGELPRTVDQLRQAAAAAREGSWRRATIDRKNNLRSYLAPIGPVAVFGPNNFPFAFGSISGGDFAAAIAAGCPVIGKAHASHPTTTRIFAEEAHLAAEETGMPDGAVQLLYRTSHVDGERLVSDHRIGAIGYTGGRAAGLKLKAAADAAGKPMYVELSSVNPVLILPGALHERCEALVDEFLASVLLGTGQFCTNPGVVFLLAGAQSEAFITKVRARFEDAPVGTLLAQGVADSLLKGMHAVQSAGAQLLAGGSVGGGKGFSCRNTLLRASGEQFLAHAEALQTEMFGNASLLVVCRDERELAHCLEHLEGNLTGTLYTSTTGSDDPMYDHLAPILRSKVGRLLNDRMPTGVAVSPAMNHGGPFPSTCHPGFTAVGIPASITRFAMLQSFDHVRPHRLPAALQDANPHGRMWRLIDGHWTREDVKP